MKLWKVCWLPDYLSGNQHTFLLSLRANFELEAQNNRF